MSVVGRLEGRVAIVTGGGRGRIVNITMNHVTMRRCSFSPYGPSEAALESETIICAQDLDGTGVTVNALLPGGATATGMILVERTRARGVVDPVHQLAGGLPSLDVFKAPDRGDMQRAE